jgi:putative SOS response-associated peptidase YedK
VVTDGFYEWKKLDEKGKEKQPYAIAMADGGQMGPFGFRSFGDDSNAKPPNYSRPLGNGD